MNTQGFQRVQMIINEPQLSSSSSDQKGREGESQERDETKRVYDQ